MRVACGRVVTRRAVALFLVSLTLFSTLTPLVPGDVSPFGGNTTIVPSRNALLFGSSGNVKIDIPVPGIAVRIEIPREFLQGVVSGENDTHFITSNIRNDYYYYNLVDESKHWTYDWRGTNSASTLASWQAGDLGADGACFKPPDPASRMPTFSYYDTNAPYCLEIWNYLNYPGFNSTTTDPTVNYCALPKQEYVFNCFTAPKFVLFHNLASPTLAGLYNFTLFIATHTNRLGYPDFTTAGGAYITSSSYYASPSNPLFLPPIFVPVSMAYNAGVVSGKICDGGSTSSCGPIRGKGIVYAESTSGQIVARAYVNQTLCPPPPASGVNCGLFTLTGLAPGNYYIEGSAGVDPSNFGVAYSLTPYGCGIGVAVGGVGCPTPTPVVVSANSETAITLPLRRAPLVCGSINYENTNGALIDSLTGNPYLLAAGFGFENPSFELNVTVEGTDPSGHVFRYEGVSTDTTSDLFNLTTGEGVKYVGTDPYGTEFAGLPAPEDIGPSGYTLSVKVWVSGYLQVTETATVLQSPGTLTPTCTPTPNQPTVSPNPVILYMGGVITGTLQFCSTQPTCTLESPQKAERSATGTTTGALFGGNIIVQAYDASGILRGVTIINGTAANGQTYYPSSICLAYDAYGCNSLRFFVTGFSEYYNHSLSGTWEEHDFGLPYSSPIGAFGLLGVGTYTLQVSVRGYYTGPVSIDVGPCSPLFVGACNPVSVDMTRGGAFEVGVGSYDNRFGTGNSTRTVQANLPWRFLNSSIPVRARVYFYASNGARVGYVEAMMVTNKTNNLDLEIGVISFTRFTFTVIFAGQNWSLQEIWFYGFVPTYVGNDNYTILAYTLGYVRQFPDGIILQNQLIGFNQGFVTMFIANEVDITVPIFANPQSLTKTSEYDQAIGQVFYGPLFGAEMANLTAGVFTLQFNIFGFGAMQLSNTAECSTVEFMGTSLSHGLNLCGQGHFFYVPPSGGLANCAQCFFDYGLDVGVYTAALPVFGFLFQFLQVLVLPVVTFSDLFLQQGVYLQVIQMASIMQGPISVVAGYCGGDCLAPFNPPAPGTLDVAPLSWAQVQASNSTYSQGAPTFDGLYDGVGALFVPAGTYNVTFSDVQYQSQTVDNFLVGWGDSYSLTQPLPLCPTGGIGGVC